MDKILKYKGRLYKRIDKSNNVKTTVKLSGSAEHVQKVCGLLDYLCILGNSGASRSITLYVDGDGAFNIDVKFDDLLEKPAKIVSKYLNLLDTKGKKITLDLE